MSDIIPVLNGGSSSLKFSIFEIVDEQSLALRITGQIEGFGRSPRFVAKNEKGELLEERHWENAGSIDIDFLFGFLVGWATGQISGSTVRGVGHRVVHGGLEFDAPVVIDDQVIKTLERLCPLAPLHLPYNLNYIKTARTMNPQIPQVACFDTAFHRDHPKMADLFALPRAYYDEGIRRYGFHGLSYEYIARILPEIAPEIAAGRVIVGHFGSGVSMCALNNGRSIDSTMGFSALDGLVMGTRPGALDAGVVLHLIREKNMSADDVEKLLYGKCGLLGLSSISNDMRDLQASRSATICATCRRAATRTPGKPSTSLFTGRARDSAPWPRRWVASTASCSPPGSARTRRQSARRSAAPPNGWAWSWTRRPMTLAAREFRLPIHPFRPGSSQRTKRK
jgi:acetate kinase